MLENFRHNVKLISKSGWNKSPPSLIQAKNMVSDLYYKFGNRKLKKKEVSLKNT